MKHLVISQDFRLLSPNLPAKKRGLIRPLGQQEGSNTIMRSLAKGEIGSSLRDLILARNCRRGRSSSFDTAGGNADSWPLKPGETRVIADLEGPGLINHIWFTIYGEPQYHRKMLFRAFWDGESSPSIDCPVGDFFGVGHCKIHPYQCLPLNLTGSNEASSGMNCFFAMPFHESARLEIVNDTDADGNGIYFYVDYEQYDEPLGDDILHFHAKWRRENPTDGWFPDKTRQEFFWHEKANQKMQTSDEGNYVILDAEGRGHYVGCNLSVHNLQGGWWGEGDDMIRIDGEEWPFSLHGTGSEDYFSNAWGMQPAAFQYHESSLPEDVGGGKCTSYRFHIEDPVPFRQSIRVSIEHSHANAGIDDYSSVAYWYQTEPHKIWAPMPKVEERLPRVE